MIHDNQMSVGIFRKFAWLVGRRLYMWSRHELTNNPKTNGEYFMLQSVMQNRGDNDEIVVMDIGANIGEWASRALFCIQNNQNPKSKVIVFEPADDTFETLTRNLHRYDQVVFNHALVSNKSGPHFLYVSGKNSKTNSMFSKKGKPINVNSVTLDQYIASCNIDHVDYIKCDTEGNDCNVIYGAEKSLESEVIAILQFEYNHRWIYARRFLKDVFDFISDKNYFFGKLTQGKIEIYQEWHPEIERFFEANYVLINKNEREVISMSEFVTFGKKNITKKAVC